MPTMTEQVEFRASPIHGTGGFARERIAPDSRVLEYVGERIPKAESLRRCAAGNPFIFHLDDTWDLDGNIPANPARFLNHSCAPNCEARLEEGQIWIVVVCPVEAGEELTFDYGYDLEDAQDYPCRCGTAQCVGVIAATEFHELLRRRARTREQTATGD
jgi:SET domain-containing protein